MSKIKINTVRCKGCGYCVNDCPRKALSFSGHINDKGYDTVQVDDSCASPAARATACAPTVSLRFWNKRYKHEQTTDEGQ